MTDQTSETTPDGLDVAAVRERVERATPGPWEFLLDRSTVIAVNGHDERVAIAGTYPDAPGHADAEFIAHARTDIPLLLAALDEARRELGRVQEIKETYHEEWMIAARELAAAESARDAAEGVVREVRALAEEGPFAYYPAGISGFKKAVPVADLLAVLDRLAQRNPGAQMTTHTLTQGPRYAGKGAHEFYANAENGPRVSTYFVSDEEWRAMGRPERITLTIGPAPEVP